MLPNVDDLSGYVKALFDAGAHKDWRMLAAALMVGLIWAIRKFASKLPGKAGAFFAGDRGGSIIALCVGLMGAFATMLSAHQAFSFNAVLGGLEAGFVAAGGYTVVKKIIAPSA